MMQSPSPTVIAEKRGHVLLLTLNRPQSLNALNGEMFEALSELQQAAGEDPGIRAIVITGTGKGFCSGADVARLQDGAKRGDAPEQAYNPRFTPRHLKIYKPSICAVNGVCAGAGLHFVADCDIVIGSEQCSFVDSHVNVGQVSALEPIGLIRRMAFDTVLRMVILGKAERLDARQALATRMISEVTTDEGLVPRALELAEIAASVSPASVQASLRAIWESLDMPLERAYENGFDILIRHRGHPDALEGPTAFREKRDPKWSD